MSYDGTSTNTRTEHSKVSKESLNMIKILNVILQYKSAIYIYWNMKCTKNDLVNNKKRITEPEKILNIIIYVYTTVSLPFFYTSKIQGTKDLQILLEKE